MTTVQPLPLRVRVFAGEDVDSYARRLAARNYTTVSDIEHALKSEGAVSSLGPKRGRLRLQVWRDLGVLSPHAFASAVSVERHPVRVRKLCLLCTHGEVVYGRMPQVGLVCVKHHRWLSTSEPSVMHLEAAWRAERFFRRKIAPSGVLYDAPIMQIALHAAVAGVPGDVVEARRQVSGVEEVHPLVYAEQVAIARMLCRPDIVGPATSPEFDIHERHEVARVAFDAALADVRGARGWAAHREVDTALSRITELRRPYRDGTDTYEQDEYGILRFALAHATAS
ncbi:hypothetical protein [Demequina sp.]|uniref:hypothetical protein n=1 Tax=Demequina sp. TaxID=2050685 RepID=UPI003D0A92D8